MKTITLFIGDENGLRDARDVKIDRRRKNTAPAPAFGRQIKIRRAALGLSQEDLADIIGIHQVTLCRFETGVSPLTDKMRYRIDTALEALEK